MSKISTKWQVTPALLSLFTVALIAGAQSSADPPLPEVAALVQQTILQQRFAESREQDYVFRQDTNDIRLRKECTWAPKCPAPFGSPGVVGVAFQVVQYSEHHFEIFWLDGIRVARALPSCDDCGRGSGPADAYIKTIPLSDGELAAENQRVDSEVAEANALRAQGKEASSPDDPPQILFSKILELCTFSNPRREVVEGRSTILLDFAWNPAAKPVSANETLLKSFSGTVGIDEEDQAVQHMEGRFIADVKLDGGNIKIRKGTRVTITNRRVDTGIWLLSRLDARGGGRYYAFAIDGDGHIFTGNYRKFHATSRVLFGLAEMPTDSTVVSTPKSPPPTVGEKLVLKRQAPESWTDPSTGLMWAGKDNGKDVNWKNAVKYCRDLRLSGYSDWRLATLAELEGIYDKNANAPGLMGPSGKGTASTWHVKGNLFLTGNQWSSSQRIDDRGHPSGYVWRFDFNEGRSFGGDEVTFYSNKRALCVRDSGQ